MRKVIILVFFLLLFVFYYPILANYPSDSWHYIQGIQEQDISFFDMPLLFLVSFFIPVQFLFVVPFACFFGSLIVLFKLFEDFGLNVWLVPLFFLVEPQWMSFLFLFHRETLLFFVAALFFYFFVKVNYEFRVKWFVACWLISILAFLTKEMGFFLILFMAIYSMQKGFFLLYIDYRGTRFLGNYIKFPSWENLLVLLGNPVLLIQLFLIKVAKFKLYILLIAVISVCLNASFDIWHVYRYTYFFMPFIFFNLALTMKELSENKKKIVLAILIIILIYDIDYFYNLFLFSL